MFGADSGVVFAAVMGCSGGGATIGDRNRLGMSRDAVVAVVIVDDVKTFCGGRSAAACASRLSCDAEDETWRFGVGWRVLAMTSSSGRA